MATAASKSPKLSSSVTRSTRSCSCANYSLKALRYCLHSTHNSSPCVGLAKPMTGRMGSAIRKRFADESSTVKISYGKETRELFRHAYCLSSFQPAEMFVASFVDVFVYRA